MPPAPTSPLRASYNLGRGQGIILDGNRLPCPGDTAVEFFGETVASRLIE
jgi:hypothetical protein